MTQFLSLAAGNCGILAAMGWNARWIDRPGGPRSLGFEIISCLASVIFAVTGFLILFQNPGKQHYLEGLVAVGFCVFGLYGAVMGLLQICDILRRRSRPMPLRPAR